MRSVTDFIDPRVLDILNASHAPLVTFGQMIQAGACDLGMIMTMNVAAGCYDTERDLIAIHDNALTSERSSEVILHELIHWTGHPRRLGRATIVNQLNRCRPSRSEYDTEEATAQMGMYKLAMALGLDRDLHETALLRYLPLFPSADFDLAERDSDLAVSYLLGLAGLNSLEQAA